MKLNQKKKKKINTENLPKDPMEKIAYEHVFNKFYS